jgi:hypothetical protein
MYVTASECTERSTIVTAATGFGSATFFVDRLADFRFLVVVGI